MKKQVRAYYSGRVQGVGFRFTAVSLADSLGINGWVKNLSDGRVEVVAEAEEEILKEFLFKVSERLFGNIGDVEIEWRDAMDGFKDFEIKF